MRKDVDASLKSFIRHMPGAIYWKDVNGCYLACSNYLLKESNFKDESYIVGKTDYDLFPKSLANKLRNNELKVIKTGSELITEESIILPQGGEKFFQVIKVPLKDESGVVIGILGNSVDITDRKRMEKLRIEKEMAEKISEAVVEVISGCVAHELRTPLAVISVNIDNLKTVLNNLFVGDKFESVKVKQKNEIEKFVSNMKLAIYNANTIITMLLIKLHALFKKRVDQVGGKDFELSSIKLSINEAIGEYPYSNREERESVIWDNKLEEDFIYRGSLLLTKHVLFNLIKNALRAIKEVGRGKVYISLKHGKKFNYLIFKDTASGIPAKIFKTLFCQFNSGNKEGTGLGLAFCKKAMLSYGGDIICNSKEGEYTQFVLNFPRIASTN